MANRFWVGGTGTWDASDTTHWAATSNGAGGQTVPVAGDNVTFDASSGGGTVTVNHASLNVASIVMGAFTGTLDFAANDNNITLTSSFSNSGTGTRTLNMGDGTWTITGTTGSVWDQTTITNLTFNANSSTINFAATPTSSRTIALGTVTYNNIAITDASATSREVNFGGVCTISGTLTFNSNLKIVRLTSNFTVTGAWTWPCAASAPATIHTNGAAFTITMAATNTLTGVNMGSVTKAGAGSLTITDGYDLGNNTSVTINNPSGGGVVARVIGG